MSQFEHAFQNHYPPRISRVHEVCGAGAYVFAVALCVQQTTPIIWIYNALDGEIYHDGFGKFGDVENIYFVNIIDDKTQLWCMEEALNSASAGCVICERNHAVSFRDMRRLQLAAERGRASGIFITSERLASPATETRWRCEPLYDAHDERIKSALQRWSLIKNKQGALGEWEVNWDDKTHRIALV